MVTVIVGSAAPSLLRMAARFLGAQPDMVVAGLASTASGAVALAIDLRPSVVVLGEEIAGEFAGSYAERIDASSPPPMVVLTDAEPPVPAVQFVKKRDLGADLVPAIHRAARRSTGRTS